LLRKESYASFTHGDGGDNDDDDDDEYGGDAGF
jgi:hypothetical protein